MACFPYLSLHWSSNDHTWPGWSALVTEARVVLTTGTLTRHWAPWNTWLNKEKNIDLSFERQKQNDFGGGYKYINEIGDLLVCEHKRLNLFNRAWREEVRVDEGSANTLRRRHNVVLIGWAWTSRTVVTQTHASIENRFYKWNFR